MSMPLMPGLVGEDAAANPAAPAGDLTSLLDSLDDGVAEELASKSAAAAEAGELGGDEAGETPADEASETPEQQAAEAAAGTEMHDPASMLTAAEAAVGETASALEQLEQLRSEAEEHEDAGLDLASLDEAQDAIEQAQKEAEEARDECEKAGDDLQACAEASARAEAAAEKARAALDKAKADIAAASDQAAAENGPPEEVQAMQAWASKVLGG